MASKPTMMQGKPAAQHQDPIPMSGKCATGTQTVRGKGGDRAKKVRRRGLSLIHSTIYQHTRLLTHTEHTHSPHL